MNILYIDNDIKYDDVNEPVKPFFKNNFYHMSTSIFKVFYREISEIRINTDKNLLFFFSNYEETKSYKFLETR